jgi:hypothetical protein
LSAFLAVCAAAQAGAVTYDFGSTVNFTCGSNAGGCPASASTGYGITTPGVGGGPGAVSLYLASNLTYSTGLQTGEFVLTWSGTGENTLLSSIPTTWDFSIVDLGTGTSVNWDLTYELGGTTVYDTGTHTSSPALGSYNIPTSAGATLGNWSVALTVNYMSTSGGNNVTISVLPDSSIDMGVGAPEPETWGLMAIGGLLFGWMKARRKSREHDGRESRGC